MGDFSVVSQLAGICTTLLLGLTLALLFHDLAYNLPRTSTTTSLGDVNKDKVGGEFGELEAIRRMVVREVRALESVLETRLTDVSAALRSAKDEQQRAWDEVEMLRGKLEGERVGRDALWVKVVDAVASQRVQNDTLFAVRAEQALLKGVFSRLIDETVALRHQLDRANAGTTKDIAALTHLATPSDDEHGGLTDDLWRQVKSLHVDVETQAATTEALAAACRQIEASMSTTYVTVEDQHAAMARVPELLLTAKGVVTAEGAVIKEWVLDSLERARDLGECVSRDDALRLIDASVQHHAADQIARVDLALRSAGSSVVHAQTSPPYAPPESIVGEIAASMHRYLPWLEIGVGGPEEAISQGAHLGNCFAFAGESGRLTVRLAKPARPSAISIEHVPRANALDMGSAPRDVEVWGRHSDQRGETPVWLGRFRYDVGLKASNVQTFELPPHSSGDDDPFFALITLEVLSNHGHADYTCLYRFRVHR